MSCVCLPLSVSPSLFSHHGAKQFLKDGWLARGARNAVLDTLEQDCAGEQGRCRLTVLWIQVLMWLFTSCVARVMFRHM